MKVVCLVAVLILSMNIISVSSTPVTPELAFLGLVKGFGLLLGGAFLKDQQYLNSLSPRERARVLAERARRQRQRQQCIRSCAGLQNCTQLCNRIY